MDFRVVAETYQKLESTRKRLEMTEILMELFRATEPDLIDKVVYMTQGRLYPGFVGVELGVADKLALKALSFVIGETEDALLDRWVKEGDLGRVAEETVAKKKQTTLFSQPLTVDRVFGNMEAVARASGHGAQDLKIKLIGDILHDSSPIEAKYIMRLVVGKLRLGVADMTIVDAIAQAFATKEERNRVERAYNISPDLGSIAKAMAESGAEGLTRFKLRVGVPIRPMLAERSTSIEEILERMGGRSALEYKYDGLRIQAHIGEDIALFSRQLENVTDQFPDVVDELNRSFKGTDVIVEGECVPINVETGEMLPFQEISHRRGRKYDMDSKVEEYPVAIFLFDCLLLDGNGLMGSGYLERRNALESAFKVTDRVMLAESHITDTSENAELFFERAISAGCEGIMAKMPDSIYKAGARAWQWIKYKRDYRSELGDSVDLVIVGAISGKGKRKGLYGALLMASYDPDNDRFTTVCKLGTGFSDAFLVEMKERLEDARVPKRDPRIDSTYQVDQHFIPRHILEVTGAEITLSPVHTCAWGEIREGSGLAIRFPRYTGRWRDDKAAEDATTNKEMVDLYLSQKKRVD